jgi:signal transduction histidine kinase
LETRVNERTIELKNKNKELENEINKRNIVEHNLYKALEKEKELNELKSRVVTTVSHEFKTPLTSILSSVELLQRYETKDPVDEKISKHYEFIKRSAKVLTQMINDMLLIEKIEADKYEFHFEKENIERFTKSIIDEFKESTGKNHIFKLITENIPQETDIEKTLLRRILNNLISNAVKYSEESSEINISLKYKKKSFEISISDSGIGIPEEDKKHLFNLFHRAKNVMNYDGTGLGLSIIQRSLDLLKGNITFKSELGVGSTFTVVFPDSKK